MNTTDKTAKFLQVLQAHKGIVYKVANAYCQDAGARQDLVQEISIQLWKSFDRYSAEFQYSTWIYRIALNTAISFYRKEKKQQQAVSPLHDGILQLPEAPDTGDMAAALQLLQQFIQELKALDKALMLLYLEEKSYKDIAAILGISVTNVATKISRIKILLQQKFINIKN